MSHPSLNDLTGKRFGRLTVIERCKDHITSSGRHMVKWLCRCDCGRKKEVLSVCLKNGNSTSCGCYARKIRRTKRDTPNLNAENVIGKVYGLLTVIQETKPYRDSQGNKQRKFICQCVCGKKKSVRLNELRNGTTVSCGCIKPRIYKRIRSLMGLEDE